MLVHLPDGYKAEQVRDALTKKIQTIPDILRASLTWDQGAEMHDWQQVSVAADIDIDFCDPHSPWQRGTSENTNGLLRQYFPKGTDLSVHSALDLDWVATELNDRPRKRLGFASRSKRSDHYCCDNRPNPPSRYATEPCLPRKGGLTGRGRRCASERRCRCPPSPGQLAMRSAGRMSLSLVRASGAYCGREEIELSASGVVPYEIEWRRRWR